LAGLSVLLIPGQQDDDGVMGGAWRQRRFGGGIVGGGKPSGQKLFQLFRWPSRLHYQVKQVVGVLGIIAPQLLHRLQGLGTVA
jgi:hypothetical protein